MLEVDEWDGRPGVRMVEVHPEVSFATLAGSPLAEPKSTWTGFHLRQRLLVEVGIVLGGNIRLFGRRVGADDVLDAGVAAWTAQRILRGEAFSLPDRPEVVDEERSAAIWA